MLAGKLRILHERLARLGLIIREGRDMFIGVRGKSGDKAWKKKKKSLKWVDT